MHGINQRFLIFSSLLQKRCDLRLVCPTHASRSIHHNSVHSEAGSINHTSAIDLRGLRDIRLSSFACLRLERLIKRCIRDGKRILVDQHAFRVDRSTESALHQLVDRLGKLFDVMELTIGTFIDIEGDFDSTSAEAITERDCH